MRKDEVRSAKLLFARELAAGAVTVDEVTTKHTLSEVASKPLPSRPSRNLQRVLVERGKLSAIDDLRALHEARARVLGAEAAAGPPRFLVRVDEFPHARVADEPGTYGTEAYQAFHAILQDAGVPYLLAVLPRVSRDYLDPAGREWRDLLDDEKAQLTALRRDGVAFATHALDHRTREADPRKHSELLGLGEEDLDARLATADGVLDELALPHPVFVPPFNRFAHAQWPTLARRYEVVCGGPETVRLMGWHRAPLWRGNAVYLPCHTPLYDKAERLVEHVEQLVAARWAVWVPLTLHWGWEADAGWDGLKRLAEALAGTATSWDTFLDEVRASGKEDRR